jgi:hypothetical protein
MNSNLYPELFCAPSADALFDLAVEAVQFALPLYEMARMRSATCPRADDAGSVDPQAHSQERLANQWLHVRELLGPQHRRVVTPNNDTLYSNAWFDLSEGPVVIRVPDMQRRYYVLGLLDMYTNPFGSIGTRTTGNGAGAFLLHGPDWNGELPEGMQEIVCPTNSVWLIGRMLVDGEQDLADAVRLQDQLVIEPAPGSKARVPCRFNAGMQPYEKLGDADRFVCIVNNALTSNPPPADESEWIDRFKVLGIGPNCIGNAPDARAREALTRAIAQVVQTLSGAPAMALGGGWALPVSVSDSYGTAYRERAQVALNYIGALGIEEAMYITADYDVDGEALDGRFSYVLHFEQGHEPQVDAFWSLTAYEKETCLLAENALGRYSLGDRTRGLHHDEDGSLRIAISAQEPQDPVLRSNWLPAPTGRFYLALRLYVPGAAHLSRTFVYPSVMRQSA